MLKTIAGFDRIGEENAFAVLARATQLASEGRDIINLGIGQPDFKTPDHIVEAAIKALRDGHHGYTPATGILPLREAVSADLHKRVGAEVNPDNVVIVPGGKVTVRWSQINDTLAKIEWIESDGPPVSQPQRRGFGTDLIEKIVAHELRHPVELDFRPEGVRCSLLVPIREPSEFELRSKGPSARELDADEEKPGP